MQDRIAYQGITFDDVLLEPGYSEVVPKEVDVRTQLTRSIRLNIPILSSPMDTVTESELAIALAQEGGLGIIHKNLSIPAQTREVDKVKRSENGIITDPITLPPDETVRTARQIMQQHHISGVPITVGDDKRLVGILTRRDLKFLADADQRIDAVMTKTNLVTAPENTTLADAERTLNENKVEKLLLVDDEYRLKGLITIKDIEKTENFPNACKDAPGPAAGGGGHRGVGLRAGRLAHPRRGGRAGGGLGPRAQPQRDRDGEGAEAAVRHRRDRRERGHHGRGESAGRRRGGRDQGGRGAGFICTTRIVSGVGVPQMSAIANAVGGVKAAGVPVPVIADGGIRYSGDITKALAAGAGCVMLGGLFAGLAESPGQMILYRGRSFKAYRGMGSLGAMAAGSGDRYAQGAEAKSNGKLVPEGVEGRVPYKGPLAPFVFQMVGGLRSGMGYVGAKTLDELRAERAVHPGDGRVGPGEPSA